MFQQVETGPVLAVGPLATSECCSSVEQDSPEQCMAVLCSAVFSSSVQCSAVLNSLVQCSVEQCSVGFGSWGLLDIPAGAFKWNNSQTTLSALSSHLAFSIFSRPGQSHGLLTCTLFQQLKVVLHPDLNLSKSLHRQLFSHENFTRKSVNYHKCPIAKKQQKMGVSNKIITLGVFTLDNLNQVILSRQASQVTLPG